jgi:hypothetical protein
MVKSGEAKKDSNTIPLYFCIDIKILDLLRILRQIVYMNRQKKPRMALHDGVIVFSHVICIMIAIVTIFKGSSDEK